MSTGGSRKVILAALTTNFGIAVIKGIAAAYSGSASLLAESVHSLVDCSNQVLLLVGEKAARKPANETHPLGYGREAFFWSFLVAILLFTLGGAFSIYEGAHKFSTHEPLERPGFGLAILLIGLALESNAMRTCLIEIRRTNRHGSLWKWFRRATSADLLVVFTEDAAAILGLAAAAACIILAWITGDGRWDAVGSIMVGGVLCGVAILLAVEIKSLIIGEAPSSDMRPEIEALVRKHLPGSSVLRFLAIQTGNNEVLVTYKIHPGETQSVPDLIHGINAVEREAKQRFPEIRWQFVEPDFEA